jgi:hypothetical protein
VEPQPGLTLRAGYQEFRGTVDYALINPAGRQLTVWVLAVDTGHNARVLDAQQFAAQTTGSETVALAAQVPPNTLFVRLLARIGAATLDSSHLEDEVFYAVVP